MDTLDLKRARIGRLKESKLEHQEGCVQKISYVIMREREKSK